MCVIHLDNISPNMNDTTTKNTGLINVSAATISILKRPIHQKVIQNFNVFQLLYLDVFFCKS